VIFVLLSIKLLYTIRLISLNIPTHPAHTQAKHPPIPPMISLTQPYHPCISLAIVVAKTQYLAHGPIIILRACFSLHFRPSQYGISGICRDLHDVPLSIAHHHPVLKQINIFASYHFFYLITGSSYLDGMLRYDQFLRCWLDVETLNKRNICIAHRSAVFT